ncbi:MAG: prepilin-type N-terminal cleavage/methylation domain-containing protein [Verrucomicrobiales bacterium]|nr:prepilin-type N-terminal cleavage/methylation domain-containing protein [Verrucomicrobiales bacterium]
MVIIPKASSEQSSGLSLTELLIVVAAIGIIAAIAIPTTATFREAAIRAAATQNAKNIAQMSEALAALGVAHVIPDSMGGVEATARLLREGVIIPEGPMAGERFLLSGMKDKDIEETAKYLDIEYDKFQLRLIFRDSTAQSNFMMEQATGIMLCLAEGQFGHYLLAAAVR